MTPFVDQYSRGAYIRQYSLAFPAHSFHSSAMSVYSKPEVLSIDSLLELLNLRGVYVVGYGWLVGMCEYCTRRYMSPNLCDYPAIWVTFIGGFIAFKALRT